MSKFRFSARPVDAVDYDGVHVMGILLRFPKDAPSGGEVMIQRLKGDQPVGQPVQLALEPGQPDALASQSWGDWVKSVLQAKNLAPAEVTEEPTVGGGQDSGLGRFRPTGAPAGAETPLLRFG